jgi:large subunit ribosomal protein L17
MRHLKAHRKLGRTTEHRISMLRNMATSLIISEKGYIVTTVPKAKELRPFVEKVITLARRAQNLSGDEAKVLSVAVAPTGLARAAWKT